MNAYITYVCSDNFIPGVVALYNSVRLSDCNHDFIVLVTDDVSEESKDKLKQNDLKIVDADKIYYNGKNKDKILDRYGKVDQSWKMFTKINIWKQTEYSKLIYLDADTLVLKNIDELFEIDELGAVLGGSVMLNYSGIEAGVLVTEPNIKTYNNIIDALESDSYDIKTWYNKFYTRNFQSNVEEE
jgi:alpha-N-acetylglucosamine transferase